MKNERMNFLYFRFILFNRGGVEDTRLEAKDTKKIQRQGPTYWGQRLSRPKTGMLEAKDQGYNVQDSGLQKKRSSRKSQNFREISDEEKKRLALF